MMSSMFPLDSLLWGLLCEGIWCFFKDGVWEGLTERKKSLWPAGAKQILAWKDSFKDTRFGATLWWMQWPGDPLKHEDGVGRWDL